MDIASIGWAALIGAAGGIIGYLLSLVFPRRMRAVVIGVAIAGAIAATGPIKTFIQQEFMTPDRFERMAMEELRSSNRGVHKIMMLYKEHEPELYRSIMDKASTAYRDDGDKNVLADVIRTEVAVYMATKVKDLSDEGILQYTELLSKQLRQLGTEGRDSICMKMLRQEKMGAVDWSDEMIDLEYQLARSVVTDSGGSGQLAEREDVDKAVNTAIKELQKLHGEVKVSTIFGAFSVPGAAPEGACVVFADYFRLLKEAAEPKPAQILRTIFTAGS